MSIEIISTMFPKYYVIKKNIRLFSMSLGLWIMLVLFFKHGNVWNILFISTILFFSAVAFGLKAHWTIAKRYHLTEIKYFNINDMVSIIFYILPLMIVFIATTIYDGKTVLELPNFFDFFVTIIISLWFAFMQNGLIKNCFIQSIMVELLKK